MYVVVAVLVLFGARAWAEGVENFVGVVKTVSGNSVRLENEMMKLGDVNRDYSMGTNIKRSLHQMMLSVLK